MTLTSLVEISTRGMKTLVLKYEETITSTLDTKLILFHFPLKRRVNAENADTKDLGIEKRARVNLS